MILPIYRYMGFDKTVTIQLSSGMTKLKKIRLRITLHFGTIVLPEGASPLYGDKALLPLS